MSQPRTLLGFLLTVILLGLSSFAGSGTPAANARSTNAAQDPAPQSAPSSDFGHLRVYIQHAHGWDSVELPVFVDDKKVLRIQDGEHATIKLTPGMHTIRSDVKDSIITLDVKPGEDYFVRLGWIAGTWHVLGTVNYILPEQGAPEFKLQDPVEKTGVIIKDMVEDAGPLRKRDDN